MAWAIPAKGLGNNYSGPGEYLQLVWGIPIKVLGNTFSGLGNMHCVLKILYPESLSVHPKDPRIVPYPLATEMLSRPNEFDLCGLFKNCIIV